MNPCVSCMKRYSTTRLSQGGLAVCSRLRDWAASTGTWYPNCCWLFRRTFSGPVPMSLIQTPAGNSAVFITGFAAACYLAAACLLVFYQPGEILGEEHAGGGRPLSRIIANPALILAVASGSIAFVIMSFVMTATPISMHMHHGHSMADAKWVIQSHIAAMFLPSLVTAWLFKALSIRGLMLAGLVCYGLTILIGLYDVSVIGFWGQLVMLGIGWNFMFVAGTALLPTSYEPGEQYKAQAFNDTAVFSSQAVASLSAGWAISVMSWQSLLLLCLLPMGLMIGILFRSRSTPL